MGDNRAIGVFDSGLGGLCAVREILKILPNENIIYFGDTGRVPYGGRSYEIIRKYGKQDVNFLLSKDVKIVLAACGTVSSVALDYLRENISVPIIGVVESACEKALEHALNSGNKKIGVIGTQATVAKGAYEKFIKEVDINCEVYAKACPLFVPLVENGHLCDEIVKLTAEFYLAEFKELNLSSLILGCTHYPMIKNIIAKTAATEVIDSGAEAAYKLKKELIAKKLLNLELNNSNEENKYEKLKIYTSDEGVNFSQIASNFLGFNIVGGIENIDIEKF